MIIANMATYPARRETLLEVLETILPHVDRLNICLNNYGEIPVFLNNKKINAFIPEKDYCDVGKFVLSDFERDDDVFYMDDDIIYPEDYVDSLRKVRDTYSELNPVVGVHGVMYPDLFDGIVQNRKVFNFRKVLKQHRVVNQLGTGTVHCKGFQAANLEFMLGSERYVDVRYARHAAQNSWPMICVRRAENWMVEKDNEDTVSSTSASQWPIEVIRESQFIGGYRRLDIKAVVKVESDLQVQPQ